MLVQRSTQRRRGAVLVYVAPLFFVCMAMAGMVIDLGLVRVTQRQMATATDTAALEGLRGQDDFTIPDPQQRDQARRQAAHDMVNRLYNDNLSTDDDATYHGGAGPAFVLSGGVGLANALQTITPANPPFYRPSLQLNLENQPNGDMAAGTFGLNPAWPSGNFYDEDQSYNRYDFQYNQPGQTYPAGQGVDFLVRLRRSNNLRWTPAPVAGNDAEPGVSSHGAALPLLFARGSTVAGGDPAAGYSPRFHGVTVRTTSIAQGRPTVAVGRLIPNSDPNNPNQVVPGTTLRGLTSFALYFSSWTDGTTFPNGTRVTVTISGPDMATLLAGSRAVGFFHGQDPQAGLTRLGDTLSPSSSPPNPLPMPPAGSLAEAQRLDLYVPLIDPTQNNQIVGFGQASMTNTPDPTQPGSGVLQILKRAGTIAPENATAVLAAFPNRTSTIIQLAQALQPDAVRQQLLLVPALVRQPRPSD